MAVVFMHVAYICRAFATAVDLESFNSDPRSSSNCNQLSHNDVYYKKCDKPN